MFERIYYFFFFLFCLHFRPAQFSHKNQLFFLQTISIIINNKNQLEEMPREKGVWLSVYVEKPSKRISVSRNHHHHHHLYVHRARKLTGNNGGGYNRKAQLLEYSRQLRESARSQANSPLLHPKPASHDHQQNLSQIVPMKRKPKRARNPTCMDWKLLIPSFLRSFILPTNNKKKKKRKTNNQSSAATKMKTVMKRFQVGKNKGFLSKMYASLRKHR